MLRLVSGVPSLQVIIAFHSYVCDMKFIHACIVLSRQIFHCPLAENTPWLDWHLPIMSLRSIFSKLYILWLDTICQKLWTTCDTDTELIDNGKLSLIRSRRLEMFPSFHLRSSSTPSSWPWSPSSTSPSSSSSSSSSTPSSALSSSPAFSTKPAMTTKQVYMSTLPLQLFAFAQLWQTPFP